MNKNYDINQVILLRDEQKLKWKDIEELVGVSSETLRKQYAKEKKGLKSVNPNCYKSSKLRGLKRKYEIILEKGGKCECCGYNKNIAALEFHHINPEEKDYQLDLRAFSNYSLEHLRSEISKCKLLCANCHRELHNEELTLENIPSMIENIENKTFTNKKSSGSICPVCGKKFPKVTGKIYCSEECKWKAKGYPSIEEVNEQYRLLGTWEKVAQYFGLTRRVIQGIRQRSLK